MRIHFIAIGGSVMHNLAIMLKNAGHEITGSDDTITEPSRTRLKENSLLPNNEGWSTSRISNHLDAVIVGMHAREDNPELDYARELGIKIYSFPEFIYGLTKNKTRTVIAGSNGKTTVTAMVLHVLEHEGKNADYLIGTRPHGYQSVIGINDNNKLAVLEGDEYYASPIDKRPKFMLFYPDIALITGIAWEHMNAYRSQEEYINQFRELIESMPQSGTLIYNSENPHLNRLLQETNNQVHTVSYTTPPYTVKEGTSYLETSNGEVPVQLIGRYNMENAEAARQVCKQIGIPDIAFYEAIPSFKGVPGRLEMVKATDASAVFIDYAHAPAKVKAVIEAVKEHFPERNLIACLELHTFTSLNVRYLKQYRHTMDQADFPLIYFNPGKIKEKRLPQLPHEEIKKVFGTDAKIFTSRRSLERWLLKGLWNKTNLLLMSSGSFSGMNMNKLADKITEKSHISG